MLCLMKSDAELIKASIAGDAKASSALVVKYRQRIYRFIYKRVHNSAIAEELTQDVFLDAFKHLSSFRGDSQLYTWLCTNALRKVYRQPRRSYKTEVEATLHTTPEDLLMTQQTLNEVNKSLDKLPVAQRKALLLREYEDLEYSEIGDILSCTPLYAKKLVWKAKKQLRKEHCDK